MEVTSINTTIVVHCEFILTLIFYFWIYFIYSATPVILVSYTKLTNLFTSVRKHLKFFPALYALVPTFD